MQQSKTRSVKLLRKILSDLKTDIYNYANDYTYLESIIEANYPEKISKLKKMAEQAILDKEYLKAITYYTSANQYIDNQEYRFDVQILFLKRILEIIKANKKEIISMLQYRQKQELENGKEENYFLLKKYEIQLNNPSVINLCQTVNNLIKEKYFLASALLLDIAEKRDYLHKHTHVIDYLRAKICEFSRSEHISSVNDEMVNNVTQTIHTYIENKQYDLAYEFIKKEKCKNNNPNFYYYLGKACYKMYKMDEALKYFNMYKEIGIEKYPKTQMYLYHIYLKQNKIKKAMQEFRNALEIESIVQDFSLLEFEYFPAGHNQNEHDSKYDIKPSKVLRQIKMGEEDFLKRD